MYPMFLIRLLKTLPHLRPLRDTIIPLHMIHPMACLLSRQQDNILRKPKCLFRCGDPCEIKDL
jgi:hypothetical protein